MPIVKKYDQGKALPGCIDAAQKDQRLKISI